MVKPLREFTFLPMGDHWQDVDGRVLADVLAEYEIVVDDRTQFARLYDYERMECIYYRASAGRVRLTFWQIPNL